MNGDGLISGTNSAVGEGVLSLLESSSETQDPRKRPIWRRFARPRACARQDSYIIYIVSYTWKWRRIQ
jgi:hypothetical protein